MFVYGKDERQKLVSVEVKGNRVYLYREGSSDPEIIPYQQWVLTNKKLGRMEELEGRLHFNYKKCFTDDREKWDFLKRCKMHNVDQFVLYNQAEQAMVQNGYTLFKELPLEDVSVLAFDIEAAGLTHDETSEVFIIANTLRKKGQITRKLFRVDEYESDRQMIQAWCEWVRKEDPSIMLGHNVFGYDLPYLRYCGGNLPLGKDGSNMEIENFTRKFRKDGSQSYDYNNCNVFGRQVIDTMFLSIKYDFGRKYISYGLKAIIEQEGLAVENRQFYDASQIAFNWVDPNEREKIVRYAEHDGDDALALYDLMIPSFYYYTRSIPMNLQQINNSATGKQVNMFLLRSYLQDGHSVPQANDKVPFQGAISMGNPGVYENIYKVDVASLYPSIILTYNIADRNKDPKNYFYEMVQYFTNERLKNKQLGRDTGKRYYKDLEQSQKIFINSAYGLLGAPGLNFNSPSCANSVTRYGREILEKGMAWVDTKGYKLVNVDTDSFSYTPEKKLTLEEFNGQIDEINEMYEDGIRWEDDGVYERGLVLKAKNYVLLEDGKRKIKGSALKDQKKELALREMLGKLVDSLLYKKGEEVEIYHEYVKEAYSLEIDVKRWATKKTVTKKIFESTRANETKVADALEGKDFQEGDKIWVYPALSGYKQKIIKGVPQFVKKTGEPKMEINRILRLVEDYRHDLDKEHLLKRLYDTVKILENVLDLDQFINYNLKSNKEKLQDLVS